MANETFSFEEAVGPETFSFEDAIGGQSSDDSSQFVKGAKSGVTGLKSMWESAGILKDAGAAKSTQAALKMFDDIEYGRVQTADQLDTRTPQQKKNQRGDMPSFVGQQARQYLNAAPDVREIMRNQMSGDLANRKELVSASLETLRQYQEEQQKTKGRVTDLTDVGGVKDFTDWLAFNAGSGAVSMAPIILAAAATGGVGAGVIGYGMAAADINKDRIDDVTKKNGTTDDVIKRVQNTAGSTMGAAIPYTVLDVAAGPARGIASNFAKDQLKRQTLKQVAKEIPGDMLEEGLAEAGQEAIKIGTSVGLGEKDKFFTAENAKQIFNAGAAGAAGAPMGTGIKAGQAFVKSSPEVENAKMVQSITSAGSIDEAIQVATASISEPTQPIAKTSDAELLSRLLQESPAEQTPQAAEEIAPTIEEAQAAVDESALTSEPVETPTAMQLAMQRAIERSPNGPTGQVLGTDTERSGNDGNNTAGGMGDGGNAGPRPRLDATGIPANQLAKPVELPSAAPAPALDQRLIPTSKRNEQNTAPRTDGQEAQAAPVETRAPTAGNATTTEVLSGAGSAAVQTTGIENEKDTPTTSPAQTRQIVAAPTAPNQVRSSADSVKTTQPSSEQQPAKQAAIAAERTKLEAMRKPKTAEVIPQPVAPQGKEVSRFNGKFGKGMGKDAARLEASRLNRTNDGITYTAEEHDDPKLENPYAVVGRKTTKANKPQALVKPNDVATKKVADDGAATQSEQTEARNQVAQSPSESTDGAALQKSSETQRTAQPRQETGDSGQSKKLQNTVPSKDDTPVDQAKATLDASNITGKERLDIIKAVKSGELTVDEVKEAYPAKQSGTEKFSIAKNEGEKNGLQPGTKQQQDLADKLAQRLNSNRPIGSPDRVLYAHSERVDGNETLSKSLAATKDIAKRLFGHEVVFISFDGAPLFNGAMSTKIPGVVFINANAEKPHMAVLGHELLHTLRTTNPSAYAALDKTLTKLLDADGVSKFLDKLEGQYKKQGMEMPQNWDEELFADVVGDNFMDPEFWQAMSEEQPSTFKRIANAVLEFLNNAIEKMTGNKPFGTDKMLTDVEAAREAVVQAMREYSGAQVGAVAESEAGERYSISQDQTETEAFKKWFGDSKVVDADGKPLVVYHGTAKAFNKVNMKKGAMGLFWMTSDKSAVEAGDVGAQGSGAVMPLYASIKNPAGWKEYEQKGIGELKRDGFDGIILPDSDGSKTFVIFEPAQVKSAVKNNGAFDPNNSDIRFSINDDQKIYSNLYSQEQIESMGRAGGIRGYGGNGSNNNQQQGPSPSTNLPDETRLQKVQRLLQDKYNRVKLIQDLLLEDGGTVGEKQDVYRAEERMHGRVHEVLRDFADDVVNPLVKKATKYGVDLNELAAYAYAKHAAERNAQIQTINKNVKTGSGMSDADAQAAIDAVKATGKQKQFEELHAELVAITSTTRRLMLDEGLITQEHYDSMEGQYENYVPLRGFEDVEPETGSVRPGLGRGFNTKGKETIAAMGRDSKAGDIIENIIRDYERATIRAERNTVGKTFLDLVTSNPDPALWEVQPMTRAARKINGLVEYVNTQDKGDDTIAVKVAGEVVYIKINDPLLLRAMANTFKSETSDAERFLSSTLGLYTSLLRNTITRYNPAFGVINAVRDVQMGAMGVYDELGAEGVRRYAANYAPAVASSGRTEMGKSDPQNKNMDKWMREMRFAGGTTGGVFMRDHNTIKKELRDTMLQAGLKPNGVIESVRASGAWKATGKLLHGLELIGSMSENSARLAAYATAREMGKTPAQAASIAKNLTVNFNRFGEQGQLINTAFLFYNASVQGTVRIVQMAKNPKVRKAMAGMTAAGMSLALMGAAVGGDDEDGQAYWDKIPDFEKERNLIIMLPPGSDIGDKVGTHGRYIKIPMAYGLNVFPVLGYQLADLARNVKDPAQGVGPVKAAINMVSATAGSYNPAGGSFDPRDKVQLAMAVSPTIVDAGIQLGAGVDSFGKPTGPQRSPYDQSPDSETVSAQNHGSINHRIARWMNDVTGGNRARSGAIDVEPGTVKNVQSIVGGGLGKFIGDVVNLGYLGATDAPIKDRDIPVWKSFYGEYDSRSGLTQFYERSRKAAEEFADMKAEFKLGIKREYSEEEKFLQKMGAHAANVSTMFGQLKKEEVQIAESNSPAKEKELKRRMIQKRREKIAEDFNAQWYKKESELKRKD